MNRRQAGTILFFSALMVAQRLLEPAYAGFLVVFAFLAGARFAAKDVAGPSLQPTATLVIVAISSVVVVLVTYLNHPDLRDVARDAGAIGSFFVGRYLVVSSRGQDPITEFMAGLSVVGVIVAMATLLGAAMAYAAGADAYVWRGSFIPYAHTWIPYIIVANYALVSLRPIHAKVYSRRIAYCVVATLAALSRTDLLLEALFLLALLFKYRAAIWRNRRHRQVVLVAAGAAILLLPSFLGLEVVQQRVELGVGQDDSSMGWRLMESLAFLDHFAAAGWVQWMLGFGLGARVPLPEGILDFNDNTSIPHLHNSYLTVVLKFGGLGLALLALFCLRAWMRSRRVAGGPFEMHRVAGRWIVVFVLAKAMTLHGLTEWSHLLFLGVGCMLMRSVSGGRWVVARAIELSRAPDFPSSMRAQR